MNPEKASSEKKLVRWLLSATIVLLLLVLSLQMWQIFGGSSETSPQAQDAQDSTEPLNSPAVSVSPGKAAMIEEVQALNPALSFDGLAALSAGELEQLYETGAPGLPIGCSLAAHLAGEYAGTLEMDSITWDADPELDETPAHYEVELHHISLGDFKYKVDAYTGEVLEGQANLFQNVPAAGTPDETPGASSPVQAPASQTPASQTQSPASQAPAAQNSGGLIGEEAAKAAAFTHAGISGADAAGLQIKLDWEDRVQVYEIKFSSGGKKYDYEINAATGAVCKAEQEWDDARRAQGSSSQDSAFIGEDAAKTAALTHAGVSEADAGYIQCKLDQDDGRWLYEVEFRSGGLEYEYEIDAATGAILKAEQDR